MNLLKYLTHCACYIINLQHSSLSRKQKKIKKEESMKIMTRLMSLASILVPYIYPVDPNLFEVRRQIRF